MRIGTMVVLMSFWAGGFALAATVDLNDGQVLQGDIIKQDAKSLQISVDGVAMTYYADEIKDIDGKPFGASASSETPPPVAPIQPQSVTQLEAETKTGQMLMPGSSAEGIDPEKKELILKFIEIFGTRQALSHNFDVMLDQIGKSKPEEAAKFRERVKVDEIIERLLPVYDRNYSTEDLKAFIVFYSSPAGQKLISSIPEIMKESIQESIKYMKEKFPEVQGGTQ